MKKLFLIFVSIILFSFRANAIFHIEGYNAYLKTGTWIASYPNCTEIKKVYIGVHIKVEVIDWNINSDSIIIERNINGDIKTLDVSYFSQDKYHYRNIMIASEGNTTNIEFIDRFDANNFKELLYGQTKYTILTDSNWCSITVNYNDITTGVETTISDTEDSLMYNIQGIRIKEPVGLYIQNRRLHIKNY